MELQDSSNLSHNNPNMASQNPNQHKLLTTSNGNPTFPFRGSHHRRAHSEVSFRFNDDLDLASDPFYAPSGSFEEIGSEDDLFTTFMDIEKFGSRFEDSPMAGLPFRNDNAGGCSGSGGGGGGDGNGGGMQVEKCEGEKNVSRSRHRHSNSVDGSSSMETIEAKKAMAPDQLAELWTVDPKRVKRILANRQSAARSKERKSRYMSELERKVQTLQTEATTLSAQLTLFQRDTSGLSNENTELKFRLQAMEQQAQLRDAFNEALKSEVERLKMNTGETMTSSDQFIFGMHHIPYSQPSFFSQPHVGSGQGGSVQMPQFNPFQPNMASHHQPMFVAAQSHVLSEMVQQDSLGRFQELDISSRGGPNLVKPEGPSISASESSNTF